MEMQGFFRLYLVKELRRNSYECIVLRKIDQLFSQGQTPSVIFWNYPQISQFIAANIYRDIETDEIKDRKTGKIFFGKVRIFSCLTSKSTTIN